MSMAWFRRGRFWHILAARPGVSFDFGIAGHPLAPGSRGRRLPLRQVMLDEERRPQNPLWLFLASYATLGLRSVRCFFGLEGDVFGERSGKG